MEVPPLLRQALTIESDMSSLPGVAAKLRLVIPPSVMDAVSYVSAAGVNTLTLSKTVRVGGGT